MMTSGVGGHDFPSIPVPALAKPTFCPIFCLGAPTTLVPLRVLYRAPSPCLNQTRLLSELPTSRLFLLFECFLFPTKSLSYTQLAL